MPSSHSAQLVLTPIERSDHFRRQLMAWLGRVAITAMVLCLAFTVQRTLSVLFTASRGAHGSLRIQVRETDTASPSTESPTLWLDDLVVDGRRIRFESTNRYPGWIVVANRGNGLPTSLLYRDSPEPAVLECAGTSILAVFRARAWRGTIDIHGADQLTQHSSLVVPEHQDEVFVLEDPPAPASAAVLVVALLLFVLAAYLFAPWRNERRTTAWLLFFLAVFHGLFWAAQPVATTNDSKPYIDQWHENLAGRPGYFPPGYPVLLGLVGTVSAERLGGWVALVQHAMAVTAAIWTYLLARRLAPCELALVAGVLAGTLAPVANVSQLIMAEMPTLFTMTGALYFGVRSAETGNLAFAGLAGALTGWGGLLRVVPLLSILPAIALVTCFSSAQRKIRLLVVTTAVAATIFLLPVVWFACKSGQAALANSAGLHLYNRVVFEQKLLDETAPATKTLLALVPGSDPRNLHWWEVLDQPEFNRLPIDFDKTELLLHVSREGIRKNPLAYFFYSPVIAWRELMSDTESCIPIWADAIAADARLETPPLVQPTASALQWRRLFDEAHRRVWAVLSWAAVGGALLGMFLPQRGLVLALAWVPASYLLVSASLDCFIARHNVVTIPFVVILAILPARLLVYGPNLPAAAPLASGLQSAGAISCHRLLDSKHES